MNVTELTRPEKAGTQPAPSLEAALAAFEAAGIGYTVVCEGPEPASPPEAVAAA